ncbi:DUF1045 domain-containing protein [Sulfitobacter sp. PS-8MA]|uniref:DUF1045 domain-containing protein n=1 Tax=Sulfitobacter sp. PS-8MA TaxID=3237707 RepID=UPI0034C6D02C
MKFERYAIYHIPEGAFGRAGAAWLGWDLVKGRFRPQPTVEGLDMAALTETPRKYGFHATIKPPFALADAHTPQGLIAAFEALCETLPSVQLAALEPVWLGRFFALTPEGDTTALNSCAAQVVRRLDRFRAPLSRAEHARRAKPHLTPAQIRNLQDWGYPHVMDCFRFHITLSGRMPQEKRRVIEAAAEENLLPTMPKPYAVDSLTLVGQAADGMFHQILRHPLKDPSL